jgi:uncharacterized LabA/DUF88 family protein
LVTSRPRPEIFAGTTGFIFDPPFGTHDYPTFRQFASRRKRQFSAGGSYFNDDRLTKGTFDMPFYPQERIALFIDGSNLYAAARALDFDIDYKRLLEVFAAKGHLVRAFYYTALVEDQEYSPIRPLVDWLDYNGYTMVTKPTKEFTDSTGRRKIKGNMDIELAIDVLEMSEHLDHVVIFSGDGDFRRLVEAVQRKGLRVSIVSTVRSQPPMVADELRRQADIFIELDDLRSSIARETSHGGHDRRNNNDFNDDDDFDEAESA